MNETVATNCTAFVDIVQLVLDRELPLGALETPHVATCVECRGLASAARVLAAAPVNSFDAPVELADRITTAVEGDYRTRTRLRLAGRAIAAALAASVLIAGLLYLRPSEKPEIAEVPPQKQPESTPAPPPRVADRFADAGSALASITRKATDQTVTPTRQLLPTTPTPFSPMSEVPGVEPATESLASVPSSAKAGFEPIATTTKRAMNLFMRDTGLSSTPKPKS